MATRHDEKHALVRVQLLVRYKPEVPDPERFTLLGNLQDFGWTQIIEARRGKYFDLKFKDSSIREARAAARAVGKILLANPVTETFEVIKVEVIHP